MNNEMTNPATENHTDACIENEKGESNMNNEMTSSATENHTDTYAENEKEEDSMTCALSTTSMEDYVDDFEERLRADVKQLNGANVDDLNIHPEIREVLHALYDGDNFNNPYHCPVHLVKSLDGKKLFVLKDYPMWYQSDPHYGVNGYFSKNVFELEAQPYEHNGIYYIDLYCVTWPITDELKKWFEKKWFDEEALYFDDDFFWSNHDYERFLDLSVCDKYAMAGIDWFNSIYSG